MSIVSLLGIKVLSNPAKFTDPYEFEITFECLEQLKDDLEWKLTYVGSSRSLEHDQELDSLLVGPIPVGINKFILTADAPSPELIPANELVSVTVILLSCSYKEREFVRVGYYVNNEYDSEELRENPPAKVQVDHIVRNILAEKPRVTRFNIAWDNDDNIDDYPPEQGVSEELLDDEDELAEMGTDGYDDAEEEEDAEGEDGEEEVKEEVTGGPEMNGTSELEVAKRQNTVNDDDIPEIKKRKLEIGTSETDLTGHDDGEDAEDKEEDLDELEEEDEEELEAELEEDEELEDEEEGEEELEEEAEEEEGNDMDMVEDDATIEADAAVRNDTLEVSVTRGESESNIKGAETPKLDSPTPISTPTADAVAKD